MVLLRDDRPLEGETDIEAWVVRGGELATVGMEGSLKLGLSQERRPGIDLERSVFSVTLSTSSSVQRNT